MANGTLKVSNIQTSSGSGTITLGQSGETVTIASGVTQTIAVNTPAFQAYNGSDQTISNNTNTKINANTEFWDIGSCYDTSNYRFTPNVAGKYLFYGTAKIGLADGDYLNNLVQKNGSTQITRNQAQTSSGVDGISTFCGVGEANGSSDYFEWFVGHNYGSDRTFSSESNLTFWGAYKLIGV